MLEDIMTWEGTMKKFVAGAFAVATIISSSAAFAQQNLVADCAPDIAKYCSNVTPGAHRIVACLISYEDKISPRCRMTAYLGSDDLGVRMKALKAMAKSCSADILQYCSSVSGGWRPHLRLPDEEQGHTHGRLPEPNTHRSAVHEGLISFGERDAPRRLCRGVVDACRFDLKL